MLNVDILFSLLEKRNIKQSDLSKATGISTGNISDWKKGKSFPSAEKLVLIADYLGCSTDYLLGRTDSPNATTGSNINSVSIVNGSNGDHSPLTVNGTPEQHDNITKEFMQVFDELELSDKVKAMDHVIKLKKKEGE